jgi:hypothetical protein
VRWHVAHRREQHADGDEDHPAELDRHVPPQQLMAARSSFLVGLNSVLTPALEAARSLLVARLEPVIASASASEAPAA